MENVIKRIEAKIAETEKLAKAAKERGNIDAHTNYQHHQTGLLVALIIALEEQGKGISGE